MRKKAQAEVNTCISRVEDGTVLNDPSEIVDLFNRQFLSAAKRALVQQTKLIAVLLCHSCLKFVLMI